MKLTALGKYGPYAKDGGACSGYLLQEKGKNILVECGNGVLSRLQEYCSIADLNCVVISHWHSDHMSDLLILRYAIAGFMGRGLWNRDKLTVFAPPLCGSQYEFLQEEDVFQFVYLRDEMNVTIGGMEVTFKEMTHPVLSYAMKFQNDGHTLVYSGDTNMNPAIIPFVKDADIFVCDAGLLERDKGMNAPHLSAMEAGMVAKMARVKRLLLSHMYPLYDEAEVLEEARTHFAGACVIAERETIEI